MVNALFIVDLAALANKPRQIKGKWSIAESKNPTGKRQLFGYIYKDGQAFELRTTKEQIHLVIGPGLEPGTAGLPVQHANHWM